MRNFFDYKLIPVLLFLSCLCNKGLTQNRDSLHFPLQDRRGDRFSWNYTNPFDLPDTSIIKQDIQYDPATNQYYIIEKVGDLIYRKPTYLTFDEMYRLQAQQQESDYFNQRAQTLLDLNRKVSRPPPRVYDKLFDRIFGLGPQGLKVDIKPQGTIDITMGYQGEVIKNPTLPESARKNGGLDFNMNTNININASIGDKLKLPISYNTLANFDYENQLKLDYKGMDDEILKSVEAGNITFQTKSTLMSSPQSLFGVKTQLQFGKLFITTALASQRSQQQSVALQGGGLSQQINKKLDDYDENRHFLLAQYFKNNYNQVMSTLPLVKTQVQIMRMEVWVTNRNGTTTNTRGIVGLMDLGENAPYNTNIHSLTNNPLPQNDANDLYGSLLNNRGYRDPAQVNTLLTLKGLTPVNDFEKTFARKLDSSEYYYNPQVGFLSLNVQLQPDDVLAVAYQYTYNGQVYQVGEFSQNVTVDSTVGVQNVLFLKLLKATSQRTSLPIWDLMMKNVYALDVTSLDSSAFRLNVVYQDPSGGTKRYLPQSDPGLAGNPLITILRADRLNNQSDPQPDGQYDFVNGFTVLQQQGEIVFPLLKPFGHDLDSIAFKDVADSIKQKYVYNELYDSIKAIAQTHANKNHYAIQGTVKGSSSTDIYLGAFNIPQGSVTVTAGGQVLQENTDYIIDYNLGTLKVINQAIINSGIPVNVAFENNASFGIQQRSFLGVRLDYLANKHLSLGGTIERLAERPFFTKVDYNEDPIRNTMYGLDFSYQNELPGLTRFINKLPFYNSTAPSSINAYGEVAVLKPGHPPQIGKGSNGLIYVDDFEGATSSVDLRFPFIAWTLASTPQGGLFPEATLTDSLAYGMNRAKLAWYNIEPTLQDRTSTNNPLRGNLKELSDPRVRQVFTNELFPQRTTNITDVVTPTFDMAYYPTDPGPYNFTDDVADIDANGKLKDPQKRWGGIMRSIDQTDFVTGNIQYIEFWMQDPFIKNRTSTGGKLYINLGDISEDILKDGRRFYENGLPTPNIPAITQTSVWGRSPINPIQLTQAFSNDPSDRAYQDLGFDGLNDDTERIQRTTYLKDIATNFGATSRLYQQANADPASDDYKWYRDASFDAPGTGILGRYKNYNNPQGNSPIANGNSQFSPAATLYPDNEDLNRDNTLNETEQYYEYEIDLKPGMAVGLTKYITDEKTVNPRLADGTSAPENWFLFRVPVEEFTKRVGQIPDFKSIRFIRMYMTGFEDSVVLRFATLDLVRNQWRTFTYDVDTIGGYKPLPTSSPTTINVLAVNVEENSNRQPIPYRTPPGIDRVQELSNNGVNLLQNEQAMSLQINNLEKHDSRAVFKTLNLDLRQYGEMSMFIHAESGLKQSPQLTNGQVDAVIRIGQDFLDNYYEIKIPLEITQFSSTATAEQIWPDSNSLNVVLQDLVQLKLRRNSKAPNIASYYSEVIGNRTYAIKGNPNLGEVQSFLIAVENETNSTISTEVWVNELRLSKIDEKGGYSALARADIQLADLGTLSLSANTYTYGFGAIDQQINERAKDNMFQFDAALNIDAGKLLPQKLGFSIPVYASINKTILTPEYDPYDLDILYKDKLKMTNNRDSVKRAAVDQTTIKTVNFTNVRFGMTGAKPHLWDISNFDFSYSYTEFEQTNPLITVNNIKKYHAGVGYTYNNASKFKEPFKNLIKNKSIWLNPVRDFNFNLMPSLLSFRADINRQYGFYVPRIINTYDSKIEQVDTTYDKYFTFDRYYNLRWDFTRSLNLDFAAVAFARVDEPFGQLNTKAKKDSVRQNFFHAGRNTLYQQHAALSYNVPLSKFPITDWVTAHYSYTTTYNWIGASLLAVTFGNTIENSKQHNVTGEFDFTRLYSKSKFLTAVSTPQDDNATDNAGEGSDTLQKPKPRAQVIKDSAGHKLKGFARRHALQQWRQQKRNYRIAQRKAKQQGAVNGVVKTVGGIVTMVKHVSVSYNENYDSRVPGITTGTGYFGENQKTNQPGYAYIFGKQPDANWLDQKAREGVITRDTFFNLLYQQDFQQQLNITAQLEPLREFNIDVNVQKTFSKNYNELFKNLPTVSAPAVDTFQHLSPLAGGGFTVSYISFQTLFKKTNPNQISQTFNEFQSNRIVIAKRLATANPYWNQTFQGDGFPTGYGRYQQDVLLPAFIAAYTGKDAGSISLIDESYKTIKTNPFKGVHALPNWRVTYTGLTKMPALADVFSNITITHGYSSTLSFNSFSSQLLYFDPLHLGQPAFIDPTSHNYVPFFLIPNLTIQEQFAPLIGFDITTKNQTALRFEYAKSRQLSLSLYDYQLSEVRSSSITFGGSFRKHGVNMPFKIPFVKADPSQTDLSLNLDLSFRNDVQSNSRLDNPAAFSTGGQKVIGIQPAFDYIINNRIDLRFYFEQQRVIPYISTSAPITNTRAGIELRISIAPQQGTGVPPQ